MDKFSLLKLKQGQTIFYASRSGWVEESFLTKKPYLLDGWPCVDTMTRPIMSNGVPTTQQESSQMSHWHAAQSDFNETDYLITTSRGRALRWAREGYDIHCRSMASIYASSTGQITEEDLEWAKDVLLAEKP